MLPFSKPWHGEEVNTMEILTSFLVSVVAGVVGYYVCKWLDRDSKGT